MSSILDKQVLILNSDYRPISYYPLSTQNMRRALKSILNDKMKVLENYNDFIFIKGKQFNLPKVAILKRYVSVFPYPKFSRYNVYLRDKFTCQYCGKQFSSHDLTFDHLIPRCHGGKTTWNNIVTACKQCNLKKADKIIDGKNLKVLSIPKEPTNKILLKNALELKNQEFGDFYSQFNLLSDIDSKWFL